MTIKNNPCFNCTFETGRHIGCHSTCEKYINANSEHTKLKQSIREQMKAEMDVCEQKIESIKRAKRNGGYKSNVFRQTKK